MTRRIEARLAELGLKLPSPAAPAGAYVPFALVERLVFVSGQLPLHDGALRFHGRIGETVSLEDGIEAARLCGLNLIAQAAVACGGDLDRVVRVVRLGGFVCAVPGFADHPKVLNGASDLMLEVFGEAGRHARFAVGAPDLPLGAAVEVEAVFHIDPVR
jgi:enamine deaminase RidA (YjgF/YER057c/UK114 family)